MRHLFIDYETFLIQPGCLAPPPVCMVYAWDWARPNLVHANNPAMDAVLLEALKDDETVIVAHNAAFEVCVTLARNPSWVKLLFNKLRKGLIRCTMVRENLISVGRGDGRRAFGLDACCEAWGMPVPDKSSKWRPRFGTLFPLSIEQWDPEAVGYVMGDICVRELYWKQESQARYLVDQHHQMRASVALFLTSAHGVVTDSEAAAELLEKTLAEIDAHKKALLDAGLLVMKKEKGALKPVRSKKAAEERLSRAYAESGRFIPRGEVTEKMADAGREDGNIKLDDEACRLSGDPLMVAYSEYGQAGTLLTKVRRLAKPIIQCRYNVLMATGRTSCSQGDDPAPGEAWTSYGMQLQNLPRQPGVRECLVARPGHCIVSVDYDAFEMRTWAQVCLWILGYSDLSDILNDPRRCPHVEMGSRLQGIAVSSDDWQVAHAMAYALKKQDPKAFKDLRGLAKGPNFGLPGGMRADRLADYCRLQYGVVLDRAKAMPDGRVIDMAQLAVDTWETMYREARPYLDFVRDSVGRSYGSRGTIEQFVSKRLRGSVSFTEASNGFFQGLAADIAKAAGWRLMEAAYENESSPLYGCRPLVFVHDEWLFEIPFRSAEQFDAACREMARIMVETAKEYCPDVLFSASAAAMFRWSKAAGDPFFTKSGLLLPYEFAKKLPLPSNQNGVRFPKEWLDAT